MGTVLMLHHAPPKKVGLEFLRCGYIHYKYLRGDEE
jgi:hypothetical protein